MRLKAGRNGDVYSAASWLKEPGKPSRGLATIVLSKAPQLLSMTNWAPFCIGTCLPSADLSAENTTFFRDTMPAPKGSSRERDRDYEGMPRIHSARFAFLFSLRVTRNEELSSRDKGRIGTETG